MIHRLALIVVLAVPAVAAAAPGAHDAKLSDTDLRALAHTHAIDQAAIEMGKLAHKNGGAAVQTFGDALAKDETAADQHIVAFAKYRGVDKLPDPTTQPDEQAAMATVARLAALHGTAFDQAFLAAMVTDQTKQITTVETELKTAEPALSAMMTGVLAITEKEAMQAKALQHGAGH